MCSYNFQHYGASQVLGSNVWQSLTVQVLGKLIRRGGGSFLASPQNYAQSFKFLLVYNMKHDGAYFPKAAEISM